MTTRHIIGYLLLLLLVAAIGVAFWRTVYKSERNVRHRERRARRKLHRTQLTEEAPTTDRDSPGAG
jgi:hypothetical protein